MTNTSTRTSRKANTASKPAQAPASVEGRADSGQCAWGSLRHHIGLAQGGRAGARLAKRDLSASLTNRPMTIV